MAISARAPALAKAAGLFTEIAWGVDASAGTSVVITVPQMGVVFTALTGGNTSTTYRPVLSLIGRPVRRLFS